MHVPNPIKCVGRVLMGEHFTRVIRVDGAVCREHKWMAGAGPAGELVYSVLGEAGACSAEAARTRRWGGGGRGRTGALGGADAEGRRAVVLGLDLQIDRRELAAREVRADGRGVDGKRDLRRRRQAERRACAEQQRPQVHGALAERRDLHACCACCVCSAPCAHA